MFLTAGDALSDKLVRVEGEARLRDVMSEIQARGASHAAVFDAGRFAGVVRLLETLHVGAHRIFADLIRTPAVPAVRVDTPLEEVGLSLHRGGAAAVVVLDASDEFVGIVTYASLFEAAATEQQQRLSIQAESAEQRFRSIVACAAEAIVVIDERGVVHTFNRAAEEMFRHPSDEVVGRNVSMLMPAPYRQEHDTYIQRFLDTRIPRIIGRRREVVGLRRDGTTFPMELHVSEVHDGDEVLFCGMVTEISERLRATEALRQSEEQYRLLFEKNLAGVLRSTLEGRCLDCNEAFVRMFGYASKQELLAHPAVDLYPTPAHRERFLAALRQGRELKNYEVELRRKDGSPLWGLVNAGLISGPDGGESIQGTIVDLTDRKRAEQALRDSEERYRLLFERNLAGVFHSIFDGLCLDCNEAFVRMFGYASKQELLSHPTVELYPTPAHRERYLAELRDKRELTNYEVELRRKDGSPMWGLENVALVRGADGTERIQGTIIDVTERKRAEEALRQSEERQRLLVEGVRVIFWEADPKTLSYTYVTGQALALTGYAPEQWYAPDFWVDHLHPEDRDEAVGHCLAAVQRGEPHELEYRMLKADGQWIWLRDIVSVLLGPEGVQLVRGVLMDITDRKRAENRHRALFEQTPCSVLAIDPADGSFLDFNEAAHRSLGYTRAEFARLTVPDIESRETPEQVASHIQRIMETGYDEFESEHKTKNGEIRNVFVRVRRLELDDRAYLQSILLDITERRRAQEEARRHEAELAHVARLSTMGEMASGLAHELNQPLTAVVNYAQGASRRLRSGGGADEEVLNAIERATEQAHRAAEIIRRLANFVQKHGPRRSSCNLNETVREAVSFVEADAREQAVRIDLDLSVAVPIVLADNIQIQQVILNLVRNGIEAMSEVRAAERVLGIRTSVAGDAVEVAVRDHGPGLTPDMQERIFTPFYTTKPRGMGMGLSISRSIIDAHGGRLWATSNPDRGATFHFTLPFSAGAPDDEHRSDRLRRG